MLRFIHFMRDDDGAITVDWVVLCAFMCALVFAAFETMHEGTSNLTSGLNGAMSSIDPS